MAYSDGDRDDVRFARLVGGVWQKTTVDAGKNVATGVDLAYNDNGRPGISYGWGPLKLAEWDGTRWNIQTIVKGNANNDDTSLVYHLGEPWIAYRVTSGRNGSKLMLSRRIGTVWIHTTIDTAGAGKFNALAFDSSGNPAIAYSADPDGDGALSALRLARFVGGQWSIQQLETAPGAGVHVDLRLTRPAASQPSSIGPAAAARRSGTCIHSPVSGSRKPSIPGCIRR